MKKLTEADIEFEAGYQRGYDDGYKDGFNIVAGDDECIGGDHEDNDGEFSKGYNRGYDDGYSAGSLAFDDEMSTDASFKELEEVG